MASVAPKLRYIETSETTISVEFSPTDVSKEYILQWRKYDNTAWDSNSNNNNAGIAQMELSAGTSKAQAVDLEPGTTYCLRLIGTDGSCTPGPDLIVDTEQVGCTPKTNKSCCSIQ